MRKLSALLWNYGCSATMTELVSLMSQVKCSWEEVKVDHVKDLARQ